jgi:hypothetical protein
MLTTVLLLTAAAILIIVGFVVATACIYGDNLIGILLASGAIWLGFYLMRKVKP